MNQPTGLIVEDDNDLVAIFSKALQTAGYATEVCQTGIDAIETLGRLTPHLVVLDLHLPGVSGVEVLQYIRGDERLAQTHVVISTADPQLAETLRDVIDIVLIKPVSYRQLADLAARFAKSSI